MAAISKEEYLKRYLSNTDDDVKKKRKKKVKKPVKAGKSLIIDDDVSLSDIRTQNDDETSGNLFDIAEETPLIYDEAGSTVLSRDLKDIKKEEDAKKALWAPVKNVSDEEMSNNQRSRHDSPDLSPVRQSQKLNRSRDKVVKRHDSPDHSPVRKHKRQSDSDQSPPRKPGRVHSGTPDLSPCRKPQKRTSPDLSPPRQGRNTHDSRGNTRTRHDSPDMSPPRGNKRQPTPDLSPRRRRNPTQRTRERSRNISPDLSPPRKIPSRKFSPEIISQRSNNEETRVRNDTPSPPPHGKQRPPGSPDLCPPRRGSQRRETQDQSPPKQRRTKHHSSPDLSPKRKDFSTHERKAGLHSAAELKRENEMSRRREDEMFAKMSSSSTGKGAETIHRDKEGKKRDLNVEKAQKKEKERQKMEEDEKFMEWGKGLQQSKNMKDKVEDEIYEMSKPLARYKDDKDLDKMLKEKERSEDPMLAFLQKRKTKQDIATGRKEKPRYTGPPPPPNRFNIHPGYRWDGVDRSNGFEKRRFTMLANKGSTRNEAYKWSTEDM